MKRIVIEFIIFVALCFIANLALKKCEKTDTPYKVAIYTKIVPGDSIPKYITTPAPVPDTVYSDPDIITLPPDSMLMVEYLKLRELYSQRKVYNDTLINDTSLFVGIIDTLSKNSLKKRVFYYENRKKTAIYTTVNTTILDNKGWYFGGNMGKNIQNVSIIYQYKNILFSGGYEFQNKTPVIGCFYRL